MWYKKEENHVTFNIKAQPGASKNKIAGLVGDALKVAIAAPAVDGAANKELVKFLSKTFKVSKSDIEFINGANSKQKRLRLPLNDKVEAFIKEMDER